MTLDEAKKVALVCAQADGGCSTCAGALTDLLNEQFPEFAWTYDPDGEYSLKVPYGDEEDEFTTYRPITVLPKVRSDGE